MAKSDKQTRSAPDRLHTDEVTDRQLGDNAYDQLFRTARSQNGWLDRPVSEEQLHQIWELMKWAPTSANSMPARIIFLKSAESKERLRPHLWPGNVSKTVSAPVVAIIGIDHAFFEHVPRLFPHNPAAKSWFTGEENAITAQRTAFRNGTLQGAYLMMAARAIGLDCGPMSGFDQAGVDAAFWPTTVETNFLCGLGYGDQSKLFPRHPRLDFDEACQII
jgi:3-hydroxypropanoate dehydrogenase